MAVRKTESRIPGGINPQDLGEAGTLKSVCDSDKDGYDLDNPDCYLISYLQGPITINTKNTYVVFVLSQNLSNKIARYKWIFKRDLNVLADTEEILTEEGILIFSPTAAELNIDIELVLEDNNGDMLRVVEIKQEIADQYEPLERLLYHNELLEEGVVERYNIACGGHPETSREIFNDFFPYINNTINVLKELYDNYKDSNDRLTPLPYDFVPRLFLASIVYSRMLRINKEDREDELEEIIEAINENSFDDWNNPIGVCQISPVMAAMVLKNPNTLSESYMTWGELSDDKDLHEKDKDSLLDLFIELSEENKIDIVNILRFPKSNIDCCFKLLNRLKNRDHRYPLVGTEEFESNQKANEIVADEFFNGGSLIPENEYEPDSDSLKVYYYRYLPFFNLGFGGNFVYTISGTVEDKDDSTKSMEGAKVYLYKTMLITLDDTRKCFKTIEDIENPSPENYEEVKKGEKLAVLEVLRDQSLAGGTGYDIAKVRRKQSYKLNNDEGYIIYRWGDNIYAALISERIGSTTPFGYVKSDNSFELFVRVYQPYFIKVVKEPDGINGYFDGQLMEEQEDLKFGWFLPPKTDIIIKMKNTPHMVREKDFIALLDDWLNYGYATNWRPKYPNGYYIKTFGIIEAANSQVACNTFVEALIVEAWRNKFTWSLNQHEIAMIQNEWILTAGDVPGHWNNDIDIFGSAFVHIERIISVIENPDNDTHFNITIDGTSVMIQTANRAGNSSSQRRAARRQTAANIAAALNANATIATKVIAIHGHTNNEYVAIRSTTNDPCDYTIEAAGGNGVFNVTDPIFAAVKITLPDDKWLPPWLIFQGWRNWNPVQNPEIVEGSDPPQLKYPRQAVGISGHNLFIVDYESTSKKILTLEANKVPYSGPNAGSKQDGPGFRGMTGENVRPQDIDQNIFDGIITPNKNHHWTQKVTWDWDELKNNYSASWNITRLKLYDLNWAKPIL